MSGQDRLPFVQFELAGTVGLEQGRYLGSDPERVLVVIVAGAPAPPRRRIGRVRPKDADPDAGAPTVPLTTVTVVRPDPLGDEPGAERWLGELRDDPDAMAEEVRDAVVFVNGALHAHRAAVLDPALSRRLASKGFTQLIDLAKTDASFPGLGLGVTRTYSGPAAGDT